MLKLLTAVIAVFCLIELAHLNYHRANCAPPAVNFDKNF